MEIILINSLSAHNLVTALQKWGPVEIASVVLGGEPPVQVPIHVVDSTFSVVPKSCGQPDSGPDQAGFNGILGVGFFAQDCGLNCENKTDNKVDLQCGEKECSGTKVSLVDQVQNPVSLLSVDNNGVIVELPSIPYGGQPSVDGYLVLGIGTQTNNIPSQDNVPCRYLRGVLNYLEWHKLFELFGYGFKWDIFYFAKCKSIAQL